MLSNAFRFGPTLPDGVCSRPNRICDTVFIFHRCARNIRRVSRWTTCRKNTDRSSRTAVGLADRLRAPQALRHTAPSSGIGQLPFVAGNRPGSSIVLLPGSALCHRRTQLFRCRIPQRCRRLGIAFGTFQKLCISQTHYDNRQPFRCRRRIRGIYGFPILPFDEAGRMAAYRP